MTIFIRFIAVLLLFVATNAFSYQQIFRASDGLKIRSPYYGDQSVISIRVYGDTVSAYSKDEHGKDYNDVLFKVTPETEAYKEFFFDILERGHFVILPNQTGKIEDLQIIYKGKKYRFYEAARYLNETDQCGLGMQCPTSETAASQGRKTTAAGTQGPLNREEAKEDYMTRVNIF